jgi:hypothetical protein
MNEPLPPPNHAFLPSISLPENQGENQFEPARRLNGDSLQEKIKDHKIAQDQNKKEELATDISARNILQERRVERDSKRKAEFQIGDRVKIKTWRFGKGYAKGLPEYTQGNVVSIKSHLKVGVRYDGDKKIYDTNKAHLEKEEALEASRKDDVVATVIYKGKRYKKS